MMIPDMDSIKKLKQDIENKLNAIELEEAGRLISEYEKMAPMDMELITYKTLYYLYENELEQAIQYARSGVRRYPMNGDMYYNLANVYEAKNELLSACKNYTKAQLIYEYAEDEKWRFLCIKETMDSLWDRIDEILTQTRQIGDNAYAQKVQQYAERQKTYFGLVNSSYRSCDQIVGRYHWISDYEKKYVGVYRTAVLNFVGENNWDVIHIKGEFLTVEEGTHYSIGGTAEEYLLPIAVEQENTVHDFMQEDKKYQILQRRNKQFNYYRVKQGTEVVSSQKGYYGKPIPLGHDGKRKKLVLNIFADGLSQEILDGKNFAQIMPHTYAFFRRGMICTQAYSSAEWTYPSLANYVTGLDTVHHMMFHNQLDGTLPEEVPTLAEYFQEAGYYTAKVDGEWRSVPCYGHCRGYDRYVYQNPMLGSRGEIQIADIIEHLEGFKDTDQFLWMCIGDLHDVADGFELPVGVQTALNLEERVIEDIGETSVKQAASENKIKAFKKMASHVDIWLNAIYTYIEDHYSDDEIIISLFADHGQGYLIPAGGKLLSKERAKVAFMFRGGLSAQISDEIISSSDYISIMCKLAGIPMKDVETMTNLPVCFGGEKEREYALCESLHPKDPYYATFFTKENTIYFENGTPTGEDGRFELKDYTLSIEDLQGNAVEDEDLYQKYMDIVMEHIAPLIIY
ncbi:MAG: sulfatase-like hydrolase/transferase [Lachnospiraceae bacterium]|nr:sulfatase-like hydrolase/transferase [Lachnospiraceae bacterium]